MKTKTLFIIIFLIAFYFTATCQTDSLQIIINNYIEAIGGKDNLEKISSIYIKRELLHKEQEKIRYNYSYQKRPAYRRFGSLDAKNFITCNGNTCWSVRTDTVNKNLIWTELDGFRKESTLYNANFYKFLGTFLDYENKGFTLNYAGNEIINNIKTNVIILKWPNGTIWKYYLNDETGLLYQFKPNDSFTVTYSNFKPANNILFPFTSVGVGLGPNGKVEHVNTIVEIEINQNMPDSYFINTEN